MLPAGAQRARERESRRERERERERGTDGERGEGGMGRKDGEDGVGWAEEGVTNRCSLDNLVTMTSVD